MFRRFVIKVKVLFPEDIVNHYKLLQCKEFTKKTTNLKELGLNIGTFIHSEVPLIDSYIFLSKSNCLGAWLENTIKEKLRELSYSLDNCSRGDRLKLLLEVVETNKGDCFYLQTVPRYTEFTVSKLDLRYKSSEILRSLRASMRYWEV